MKTSYEQFKADVEKNNNEILFMIFFVGLCLVPVIQILTGIFVVGWLIYKITELAPMSSKRMAKREADRRRKMGYDK